MKIDIFTLCDGVHCYENKLTVIGAYDVLNIQNFTAAPVPINIAARILFDREECGPNTIHIEGTEIESGLKVMDLSNSVEISPREKIGTGILNVLLNGVLVMFPREGKYRFTITVVGKATAEISLNVISVC